MLRRNLLILGFVAAACLAQGGPAADPALRPAILPPAPPKEPAAKPVVQPPAPKIAPSKIIGVTVYPGNALVTREVAVPEGAGSFELVVSALPPQTVDKSLYSEGTDGIRVLNTRYRQRPVQEDTREEVRKVEAQRRQLENAAEKLQSEMGVVEQNIQVLAKLENFTAANLQHLTEKGLLNGDAVIAMTKYVMETRSEKSDALVAARQQMKLNKEQMEFVDRQLESLRSGSNKTERDAVIVVDKKDQGPGKVRLNYLVDAVTWHPQYKFRAGKENKAVQLEYLAAIGQQTGEDWANVALTLSTAEPTLSAAPPELKKLEVALVASGVPNAPAGGPGQPMAQSAGGGFNPYGTPAGEINKQAKMLRQQAQVLYKGNQDKSGVRLENEAAALEQARDLLVTKQEDLKKPQPGWGTGGSEGPSVTYHLPTRLTVPSRTDEQIIEVAKIDMAPDYYYKAVPVLTPHVYRLANLTNKSEYVLLPGEATMYIDTDFVGRADLPLVAIGEQFTAGFGVDPQLQVQRQMVDKTRTTQGDNQVLKYQYRILVSSYKSDPVKLQLWDRLPHAETEAVGVSLVKSEPTVSADGLYAREDRPNNLLRWDLTVDPNTNGEKALPVNYEFKLELGRQMMIGNFTAK